MPNKPRILLLAQDPQFIYLIQRYAETGGCLLLHTDSPVRGLEIARQAFPSLILLDLPFADADSAKFLSMCKSDSLTSRIPVYICSSSDTVLAESEELADGCLLKPVMYQDLMAAIEVSSLVEQRKEEVPIGKANE